MKIARSMAWLLMLSAFWLAGTAAALAEEKRPNIIFILTDDQRLEDIEHMPILNRLMVAEGTQFTNYFSNVSLCCPSRTSILRGQFAHNTGVMTNGGTNGGFETAHARGIESSTVATWLHDSGYKTALIGKYLNHYPGSMGPAYVPPGWDYWASAVGDRAYSEYNYTLNENGKQVAYGASPADYGTDVYTRKATEFIKTCAAEHKPFFVYLSFYAPHAPATPAPRHLNMFSDLKIPRSAAFNIKDVSSKPQFIQNLSLMTEDEMQSADSYYRKRLCSLQAVDESIETLINILKESKELDDTYIFFTSDNGFHLGEHRMQRGKQTAYETDIHLPLIVRGPGVVRGGKAEQLVGNIDLAPTFAELTRAKAPNFVDGRSLVSIMRGTQRNEKNWRTAFLVEHYTQGNPGRAGAAAGQVDRPRRRGGRAARKRKHGGEAGGIPELHALRSKDRVYIEYVTGEREFYSLSKDPDQVSNLAATKSAHVTKQIAADAERLKRLQTNGADSAREAEQ